MPGGPVTFHRKITAVSKKEEFVNGAGCLGIVAFLGAFWFGVAYFLRDTPIGKMVIQMSAWIFAQ